MTDKDNTQKRRKFDETVVVSFCLRMPKWLHAELSGEAKATRLSLNSKLLNILEAHIKAKADEEAINEISRLSEAGATEA